MTFLLLIGVGPVLLAQTTDPSGIDYGAAVADLIVASPFAGLCLLFLLQTRRDAGEATTKHDAEIVKKDAEITRLHLRVEELQKEALQREQQLVAGLGPRIYDAALLYREATGLAEQVSTPPALPPAAPPAVDKRLDELTELVERLVSGMGRTDGE